MSTGFTKVVTFGLGSVILGSLFKTKQQKPTIQRIGELSEQTAKEGEPRPIVWGRVRPISGNIMHSSAPRIITREVQGQSSGGGKGGKKKQPKQYEERVFRTYAIRICEGPITAIIRVWRNNKLVYDARGNAWGAKNNGVFLGRARFYLGGWTQMPDPALESQWGAGNVPAYRGTCYMVVPDEDLTDMGGSVPQYVFEVERAEGTYLTSRPYAVEGIESIDGLPGLVKKEGPTTVVSDSLDAGSGALVSGRFSSILLATGYTESLDVQPGLVVGGEFRQAFILKTYEDGLPESLESSTGSVVGGDLFRLGLIHYDRWPVESLDAGSGAVTGGSHAA